MKKTKKKKPRRQSGKPKTDLFENRPSVGFWFFENLSEFCLPSLPPPQQKTYKFVNSLIFFFFPSFSPSEQTNQVCQQVVLQKHFFIRKVSACCFGVYT
jgi:hypothetical protein